MNTLRSIAFTIFIAAGCGAPPSDQPTGPSPCQVWVSPPGYLPVLWTCTAGAASTPPRLPCTEDADAGAGWWPVTTCSQCTPAELLRLDPSARCTPGGDPIEWRYTPK